MWRFAVSYFAFVYLPSSVAGQSLLDSLLESSPNFLVTSSNLAENDADILAEIYIDASQHWSALSYLLEQSWFQTERDSFSRVSAEVFSSNLNFPDKHFQSPLYVSRVSFQELLATGIGAMQFGSHEVLVNFRDFETASTINRTAFGSEDPISGGDFVRIESSVIIQNSAFNTGQLLSGIDMVLRDVRVSSGTLSTTAIGAMGAGDIATNILGRLVKAPN